MSLLAAPAPPEWPDFLRLTSYNFSFLISPWRFFMAICSTTLSASLVERRLAYSATYSVRLMFAFVRLVTAALPSTVAFFRLENAMDIWCWCGTPL